MFVRLFVCLFVCLFVFFWRGWGAFLFLVYFFIYLFAKLKIVQAQHSLYLPELVSHFFVLFCFVRGGCCFFGGGYSRINYMEKWKTLKKIRPSEHIKSWIIRSASTNEKLAGKSVLGTKETILKKINVSYFVHFCLGKYNSDSILFKHTMYSKLKQIYPLQMIYGSTGLIKILIYLFLNNYFIINIIIT